jgi:molybdopterin synthase sulfur carrier subunit
VKNREEKERDARGAPAKRRGADRIAALAAMPPAAVTVFVPAPLRAYSGGKSRLRLEAPSVRAALASLERSHPLLYRSVCDETGQVRRHVNLFVNTSHVREREGLETALAPGDELTILPAVSGG